MESVSSCIEELGIRGEARGLSLTLCHSETAPADSLHAIFSASATAAHARLSRMRPVARRRCCEFFQLRCRIASFLNCQVDAITTVDHGDDRSSCAHELDGRATNEVAAISRGRQQAKVAPSVPQETREDNR